MPASIDSVVKDTFLGVLDKVYATAKNQKNISTNCLPVSADTGSRAADLVRDVWALCEVLKVSRGEFTASRTDDGWLQLGWRTAQDDAWVAVSVTGDPRSVLAVVGQSNGGAQLEFLSHRAAAYVVAAALAKGDIAKA